MTDCVRCNNPTGSKIYSMNDSGYICDNCFKAWKGEPSPTNNIEPTMELLFVQESESTMEFFDAMKGKNGFTVDVQESKAFYEQNVICMKNKLGKKLYFRKGEKHGEFTELTPLTAQELKELSIEESANEENLFDIDVQESAESGEIKKKGFDVNSVSDMERAKLMAENRLKELKGETSENSEVENTEKEIVNNIKEKISLQLEAKGVSIEPSEIKTQEDMERWIGVIKKIEKPKSEHSTNQGGSAPLQNQYSQQNQGEFSSMENLIDNLRDRSSANNKNLADRDLAKTQLDALMQKAIIGQRTTNQPFDFVNTEKGTLDFLKEQYERRKKLLKGLE